MRFEPSLEGKNMEDLAAISAALAKLEAVQSALEKIAARTDEGRRRELIQLRRDLTAQIGEIGGLAEPLFATLADPEISHTYRDKFSRMRSATAMHQASWPAARLELSDNSHKQSANAADVANRNFVEWMRKTLTQLRRDR